MLPHPINTTVATPKKCLLASKVHTLEAPSYPTPTSADLVKEFATVFIGVIKTMEGEEFHISLVDDAKPFCVNMPRSIPFANREKLRAELDLFQTQGIIAPVTEPTEWWAPIVVTPKKDSDCIRLCVDLSRLNCYVRCESINHLLQLRQLPT